jgi:GNAT superfamily N-acetyltransferase
MTVEVRDAGDVDINGIVSVHLKSFAGFFLANLGPRFLARLYEAFRTAPDGILIVAAENSEILGFVGGTTRPKGFFRRLLLRDGLHLATAGMPALVRHPLSVARRFMAALAYRGDMPRRLPDAALISSVALLPQATGLGLAGRLLRTFETTATNAGCSAVYLTTDADDNDEVNRFYCRNGFVLEDVMTRNDRRRMNRYVKKLESVERRSVRSGRLGT